MPEKQVLKGIVLRETQTKETDKILTVLTAEHGKLAVIARGARRRNSRIAAASELLAYSELVVYRRGNWYMLDEGSTLSLWERVRQDIELLALASYFAELAEAVTGEDEPAEELLALLLNSLYALDALGKPPELVRAAFELKLLSLSGYEPLLDACAVCGSTAPAEPVFDTAEGVVLCRHCAGPAAGGLQPLDPGSLAAMRHVLHSARARMLSFRLDGAAQARFNRACERFTAAQLDRSFRTLAFYQSLRAGISQENPAPDAGSTIRPIS